MAASRNAPSWRQLLPFSLTRSQAAIYGVRPISARLADKSNLLPRPAVSRGRGAPAPRAVD